MEKLGTEVKLNLYKYINFYNFQTSQCITFELWLIYKRVEACGCQVLLDFSQNFKKIRLNKKTKHCFQNPAAMSSAYLTRN